MTQYILVAVLWKNIVSTQSFFSLEACEKAKTFIVGKANSDAAAGWYRASITCIKDTK